MERYTMFGPSADRPLTERLARSRTENNFAQTISAEFMPAPPTESPALVDHLLDSPPPPSAKAAIGTLTTMLLDVAESPQRDTLAREWMGVAQQIETFLAAARQQRTDELQRQIAELTPQCRAALDKLRTLLVERGALESQAHVLEEQRSKANLDLRVAFESKPDDEEFPSDAELASWDRSVKKAQAAVVREEQRQSELLEVVAKHDVLVRTERLRLADLKRRRTDARDELAGRPRKGPFGLQEFKNQHA